MGQNDHVYFGTPLYDKDMDIIPELAKNWEITEDNLNYTFHLREDVYWHDNEQFTADDIIFTWDRILDPETDTTRASLFDFLDFDLIPYEMVDDFTVVFHLREASNSMLKNLMIKIIPEHVFLNHAGVDGIKHTADDCRDSNRIYTFNDDPVNQNPIGTGCMMFLEWKKDDHITLVRNSVENGGPGNWREHDAYLDRYLLRINNDVNSGIIRPVGYNIDIDMFDLSSTSQEDIDTLIADPNINVYSSQTFTSDHIAFQTDPSKGNLYNFTIRDFTENPNHFAGYEWQTAENPDIYGYLVRQALNYAIDKNDLIADVYPQGLRNLGPMYLAQYEWHNDQINPYDYNLTKANELLDHAGFGETAEDPLRRELDFTISYNQGNLRREKTCKFVRNQWETLGIDVEIESLEWISMLSTHYDSRNFDVLSAGWTGGGIDPDFSNIWSSSNIMPGGQPIGLDIDGTWLWYGDPHEGGLNYQSYWNPEVDLLLLEAFQEEDDLIRKNYYDLLQEKIVDDSPYVWLLAHVNMIAVDADFYGFVENSAAGFWPEPIGFRNIYYAPEEVSESSTNISNSNGFEVLSFLGAFSFVVFFLKKKN